MPIWLAANHFGHGGPAHQVGADRAQVGISAGGLEAGAEHGRVDAFAYRNPFLGATCRAISGNAAGTLRSCPESAAQSLTARPASGFDPEG